MTFKPNIKNQPNLSKDNGSVINLDNNQYNSRKQLLKRNKDFNKLKERVDNIDNKLDILLKIISEKSLV